jgi:hypothetical protein
MGGEVRDKETKRQGDAEMGRGGGGAAGELAKGLKAALDTQGKR